MTRRDFSRTACEAGKDVYCEKPLSLMISEGRKMVAAARKNNRVVQTGSQQSASGTGGRYALTDGGQTPDVQDVLYQLPEVVVSWTSSETSEGDPFTLDIFGTKGTLSPTRGGFSVKPEMANNLGKTTDKPLIEPLKAPASDLNGAHVRNLLDCVKSRKRPNADIEQGHLTAVVCRPGNIAIGLGRRIQWDSAKEQVIGDSEANGWTDRPYRAPGV